MFEEFYGLTASPFRLTPDHRFFYGSQGHRKAMSYLKYGIFQGEGFIVVTGDVGTGKSTLVSQLLTELDANQIVAAQIVTTQIDADDAVRLIIKAFNIPVDSTDKATNLAAFEDFLENQHAAGRRVLLVVDEAQNLPMRTLEELRMLSNHNRDGESLFQCFLVGQPQFLRVLANPDLAQLQQRVIASYRLVPIDREETSEYILHRMQLAGWTGNPEITEAAITAIYHESQGVPRKINSLANRVMLHGSLEELGVIDAKDVLEVIRDLKNEDHAALMPSPAEVIAAPAAATPPPSSTTDAPLYPASPPPAFNELYPPAPRAAAPATTVVPGDIAERLAKIETTLVEHDRALRELMDTAVGQLVKPPTAEPELPGDVEEDIPSNVSKFGEQR